MYDCVVAGGVFKAYINVKRCVFLRHINVKVNKTLTKSGNLQSFLFVNFISFRMTL